ncbi:MAG: Do family serine endopeptidase [Candidatus Binataceae bacterium]
MLRRVPSEGLIAGLAAVVLIVAAAVPVHGDHLWTDLPGHTRVRPVQTLPDFVNLAAQLSPAVVNISTEQKQEANTAESPESGSDPFDRFGQPSEPYGTPHPHSLGSGFIVNKDGYILTNDHVVADASKIVVTLKDGREFDATVVGHDAKSDIALLKINTDHPLPVAPLGDSDGVKVGQWVVAIGDPFGFDHSVTAGIVSAKGRFIPGNYDNFIQTDASINPGNSGGPLIDMRGAVVGVNSAIYTRTGSNMGIGFAIPVNIVKEELPELRARGKVARGWLGVYIQPVTESMAKSAGLSEARGALIVDVLAHSPAAKSGLQRGDIILEYDHHPLKESQELPLMVGSAPLGQTATLKVLRGKQMLSIPLQVTTAGQQQFATAAGPGIGVKAFGIGLKDLNTEIARQLDLSDSSGVVVFSVSPGSTGESSGLHVRDIILEVDQHAVKDVNACERALTASRGGGKIVLLLVKRGPTTLFIPLKPQG